MCGTGCQQVSELSVTSRQLVANKLATSPTSARGNVTDKSCRDALMEIGLNDISVIRGVGELDELRGKYRYARCH